MLRLGVGQERLVKVRTASSFGLKILGLFTINTAGDDRGLGTLDLFSFYEDYSISTFLVVSLPQMLNTVSNQQLCFL